MQAWEQYLEEQTACSCIHMSDGAYIRDPACLAPKHRPPQPKL
jgi:hypothetical protein